MNRRDKKRVFRKAAELIREERLIREGMSWRPKLISDLRAMYCCKAITRALDFLFPDHLPRASFHLHHDEEELLIVDFIKTMAPDGFDGSFFMPAVHKNAKHRELLLLMYAEML